MSKLVTAELGSVSSGTLRTMDLLSCFAGELEYHLDNQGPDYAAPELRELVKDAYAAYDADDDNDCVDALVDELQDALEEFAPEGAYFGTAEGDGADFGFWACEGSEDDV